MFDIGIAEKLGYYVYLLEDPRNGEIFYVGKGRGNRVFFHVGDALDGARRSHKLDRIREIHHSGHEVEHTILRHGLSESMAFEIEAAMIDFLGIHRLANEVAGQYSADFGMKSAAEIVAMYAGDPLDTDEPVLLLNINNRYRRDMTVGDIYNATRRWWILGERRNAVSYVIPVYGGLTREVYVVRKWISANAASGRRWGFRGKLARPAVREKLVHKSVRHLYPRGVSNPVKYLNC